MKHQMEMNWIRGAPLKVGLTISHFSTPHPRCSSAAGSTYLLEFRQTSNIRPHTINVLDIGGWGEMFMFKCS